MTTLWRYTAIDLRPPPTSTAVGKPAHRKGELPGASAAEVRASLRRIGLQVIDLKPVRSPSATPASVSSLLGSWGGRHLRSRRRSQRAELYDSLATMIESGMPLLEAVQTLLESHEGSRGQATASMLASLRESLRAGGSLGQAMREHPGWFDATDVAIVEAGQHAGNLPKVLSSMAQRQEHANELGHKLVGALAYPFMVLLVGIGVVIFLSVKTLPQLVKILTDAKVAAPPLTLRVMEFGQLIANHVFMIGAVIAGLAVVMTAAPGAFRRFGALVPESVAGSIERLGRFCTPKVVLTMAVGGLALRLSELVQSGVPMVDALRVLGPTVTNRRLRRQLQDAADRVERGEELSAALSSNSTTAHAGSRAWTGERDRGPGRGGQGGFSIEFLRLLDIGQASGELDVMLERIGNRYQRQAKRQIDRLATLLEPVVILTLAALVGTVVMAAILPLLRLQEVVR